MPGKSPTQRIEELTAQFRQLETAFETYRAVNDLKVQQLEGRDADLTAKNATLEERARQQEKTSDRGWQLWVAVLGFAFGLINMIITGALQLKK
jgi:hypothetical protein